MLNKVTLIGRVGKDPEIRHTERGTTVANLTLATTEKYKNKAGEKCETTEWHNLQIWDKLAEVAEKYVKKGHLLYVEGKIKTESWDKDGTKHYKTSIVVTTMQMLSGKSSESSAPSQSESNNDSIDNTQVEDDLPF